MNSQPTCQILTSQSIKTGRRAWPTHDHGEKSQKQLPSPPVMAGWIFASKVNLKCILKNWTWSWSHLKTSNLSVNNFKQILDLDGSIPEPVIKSGDTGHWIPSFDSCHFITTWMCNIRLHWAPKLARKCEDKNFLGWTDFLSYGAPL